MRLMHSGRDFVSAPSARTNWPSSTATCAPSSTSAGCLRAVLRQPQAGGAAGAVPAPPGSPSADQALAQPLPVRAAASPGCGRGPRQGRRGGARAGGPAATPHADPTVAARWARSRHGCSGRWTATLRSREVGALVAEERPLLRPEPGIAFDPRRVQAVSVSRSALARGRGRPGIRCPAAGRGCVRRPQRRRRRADAVRPRRAGRAPQTALRRPPGDATATTRSASFLARKPQAVRQVAPELVAEPGRAVRTALERCWSRCAWAGTRRRARWRGCCGPCTSTASERVREVHGARPRRGPGALRRTGRAAAARRGAPAGAVAVPPALRTATRLEAASAAGYDRLLGALSR